MLSSEALFECIVTITTFPKRTFRAGFSFRIVDAFFVWATEDLFDHDGCAHLVLSQAREGIFLDIDFESNVSVFAEVAVNSSFVAPPQKDTENSLRGLLIVGTIEREGRVRKSLISSFSLLSEQCN